MKAQVLADFLVECLILEEEQIPKIQKEITEESYWLLHMDRASNAQESKAGLILANPEGIIIKHALRFSFKASNNGVEYEALVAGLRMAKELNIKKLKVFTDS